MAASPHASPTSTLYGALTIFAVLWPQADSAETIFILRAGLGVEGNPLFSAAFHTSLGLFAGVLLHAGLSLLVLAFALSLRHTRDPLARRVATAFLLCWAVLGVIVIGHNGIDLLLAWLNGLG